MNGKCIHYDLCVQISCSNQVICTYVYLSVIYIIQNMYLRVYLLKTMLDGECVYH